MSFYLSALEAAGGKAGVGRRVKSWCARNPGVELFSREGYLSVMAECLDLSPMTREHYAHKLRAGWAHAAKAGHVAAPPADLPTFSVKNSARVARDNDMPAVMVVHCVHRLRACLGLAGAANVLGVSEASLTTVLRGRANLPAEAIDGLERVYVAAMFDELDLTTEDIARLRRVARGRMTARLAELAEARGDA